MEKFVGYILYVLSEDGYKMQSKASISEEGDLPKIWMGVCGSLLETLTLFQTKIPHITLVESTI